jgi:hypothetical protein
MPNQELENENYIDDYESTLVISQSHYDPERHDGQLGRGPIWRTYNEFIYDYDEYLVDNDIGGCWAANLSDIFHDGIFLSQFARKIQRCWFNREELPMACPCPEPP